MQACPLLQAVLLHECFMATYFFPRPSPYFNILRARARARTPACLSLHLSSFCPDTPWRVIKSGPDICENILPSEQETYTAERDTSRRFLAANSKNVIRQLTKTNIGKCCALELIGEPSLITPRAAAGFDHDHPPHRRPMNSHAAIRRAMRRE